MNDCKHDWVYYTYQRASGFEFIVYERHCEECGIWEGYYGC